MNIKDFNIGDRFLLRGSKYACECVGFNSGMVELRRVHPTTGELEGGEPLRFFPEMLDAQKLGSLAELI